MESTNIYANMIAEESLRIIHDDKAETASFNVVTRELTLPTFGFLNVESTQMLVSHEIGHALYSKYDKTSIRSMFAKYGAIFNIVEDIYIESAIKSKYPGLRDIFNKGNRSLVDNKFYPVSSVEKINEMGFLDRLNMHFKCGGFLKGINFNEDELPYVAKCYSLDSNDAVRNLCEEIKQFLSEKDRNSSTSKDRVNNNERRPSEQESDSSMPSTDESFGNDGQNGENRKPSQDAEGSEFKSETMDALDRKLRESIRHAINVPRVRIDLDTQYQRVFVTDMTELWMRMVNKIKSSKNKDTKASSAFGQKVMNAAATGDTYFRQLMSAKELRERRTMKSGCIDSKSLWKYRISDNVFRNRTINSHGQSHALVIALDCSGSMSSNMSMASFQAAVLCQFAKNNGIPFTLIGFGLKLRCENQWFTDFKKTYKNTFVIATEKTWDCESLSRLFIPKLLNARWKEGDSTYSIDLSGTPSTTAYSEVVNRVIGYRAKGIEKVETFFITDGCPVGDMIAMRNVNGEFEKDSSSQGMRAITANLSDIVTGDKDEYLDGKVINIGDVDVDSFLSSYVVDITINGTNMTEIIKDVLSTEIPEKSIRYFHGTEFLVIPALQSYIIDILGAGLNIVNIDDRWCNDGCLTQCLAKHWEPEYVKSTSDSIGEGRFGLDRFFFKHAAKEGGKLSRIATRMYLIYALSNSEFNNGDRYRNLVLPFVKLFMREYATNIAKGTER